MDNNNIISGADERSVKEEKKAFRKEIFRMVISLLFVVVAIGLFPLLWLSDNPILQASSHLILSITMIAMFICELKIGKSRLIDIISSAAIAVVSLSWLIDSVLKLISLI